MSSQGQSRRKSGSVTSFDGTRVVYDYYPADSGSLVLVIPGFWRSRRYPSMVQLAEILNRLGYDAGIVDVRGHGDSGGIYGFNLHEHEDAYAVARQLHETRVYASISIIGFSIGGGIAVSTIYRHDDLPWRSLLLISPVADFSKIIPRLNPLTMHRHLSLTAAMRPPRFDWRFLASRKLKAAEEIAGIHLPVSFVHVRNDWLIHHRHSLLLYGQANEPKELHVFDIPGRYHADRLLRIIPNRLEALMEDFLRRTLSPE